MPWILYFQMFGRAESGLKIKKAFLYHLKRKCCLKLGAPIKKHRVCIFVGFQLKEHISFRPMWFLRVLNVKNGYL